ncbi:hypothetical protein Syun_000648 [Stephania yunnanensis]|uniref:Uncharacterized protein n=1 Tax=Stephania yunnanensis TaxID=152371 RepID=A0AAP0LCC8_9MAGN
MSASPFNSTNQRPPRVTITIHVTHQHFSSLEPSLIRLGMRVRTNSQNFGMNSRDSLRLPCVPRGAHLPMHNASSTPLSANQTLPPQRR